MDKNIIGRVGSASEAGRLVGDLEEFAVAFPDSRKDVIEIMERYSGEMAENKGKELKDAAQRIAAIEMLEILQGK